MLIRALVLVAMGRTILAKGPLGIPTLGKLKEYLLRRILIRALAIIGCTRYRNISEVIRVLGRSGRDNWLSSILVKLRYD
jgi:hypothetical protein